MRTIYHWQSTHVCSVVCIYKDRLGLIWLCVLWSEAKESIKGKAFLLLLSIQLIYSFFYITEHLCNQLQLDPHFSLSENRRHKKLSIPMEFPPPLCFCGIQDWMLFSAGRETFQLISRSIFSLCLLSDSGAFMDREKSRSANVNARVLPTIF